jgi:iron complex outermembrane receptor protein
MRAVDVWTRAGLSAGVWLVPVAMAQTPATPGASAPTTEIEEIVITAQRYEETLQKSSLSLQVLSGEELQRGAVTQATDLNRLVPGLQIGTGGGASQIYIRGVGDFAASALSNPAVAVNVDGVYISRPQGVNSNFYDLERLEVLRGPQGTLYGRNASGGALNLITRKPSLDGLSGDIALTLGDYDLIDAEGAINVPLGDTLALRAAVKVVERDGYLSDGTDDDERQAGRLHLLWQPSDAVSLLLSGDIAKEEGSGPGYVQLPGAPGTDEWTSASSPEANAVLAATPPIGFLVAPIGDDSFRDNTFWNVSAELNWDLGFALLTVIPGYRDAEISERNYPAGLRNTIPEATSEQFTFEARLSDATENLKWVAGLYYYDEDQSAEQQIFQGFLQDNTGFYFPKTESYAAFGQGTFAVTEEMRLIAGLRYTEEDRSVSGALFTNTPAAVPPGTPLPALLAEFGGDESFSDTTWKAGIEYDLTPENMLFVTASTGFKAGGFNQTVPPMDTYDPEELLAYELGSRNRFMDDRLQLNFEVFYWDYTDNQIAHVIFDPLGNINLVTQNAGEATIQGANVDLQAAITPDDRLRFFIEYNDATYDHFTYDTAFSIFGAPLFNPASTGCQVGTPFPGPVFGTELVTIDCSGFELPRAQEWVASFGYDHTFRLGNGATLNAALSGQYGSERWLGFEFVPTQRADAYEVFDVDLTYAAPDGRWSLAAFVHNIGDEAVYSGGSVQGFAPPLVYATIGPPRTYGVTLNYRFD